MDTGLAPIIEQKALAREIYRQASEHHYSLYQQQQSLIRIISDLEHRLKIARIRDGLLNQARGKRQHRTGYKKGKNTRKRRH